MAIRDATFDIGGAISNASDGFNSVTATAPTLDTTTKGRGKNSARCNWTASTNVNGTISNFSATEFWLSFYLVIAAAPAATCRIINLSNSVGQGDLRCTLTPTVQFRWGANTLYTTPTLSLNTLYRFGIRWKNESTLGAADGIMEAYYTTGDDDFGAAKASTSVLTMTTSVAAMSSFQFGHSNAAAATGDLYIDDIRFSDAYMPGPTLVLAPEAANHPIYRR